MPTKLTHYTLLNPKGVMAWKTDGPTQGRCVWDYHDVWRWSKAEDKAVVLRENYFRIHPESGGEVSQSKIQGRSYCLSMHPGQFLHGFLLPFCFKME